jgi:hypothetical protein
MRHKMGYTGSNMKKVALLLGILFVAVLFAVSNVQAKGLPGSGGGVGSGGGLGPEVPAGTSLRLTDVTKLISSVVGIIMIISGTIVMGVIVYAGIIMATSAGDETRYKKGKSILYQGIIGGLVIFGVGLIVRTIANFAQNPSNILR